MKKLIVVLIGILFAIALQGQGKNDFKYVINAKGGLSVGQYDVAGTNIVTQDSVTSESGILKVYNAGADILNTSITTHIEDSLNAYRAAAIPLKTSAILGQITKVTIGWDGASGTDFVWTGDAGHVAQNLDLGSIIPAKARVIAIEIVCTEALVGCTDITLGAGNASAGAQFIVASSCDDLNEVVGIINPALPQAVIMNWAAATKIWIIGDPTDNTWADMTAGKWAVYVTYIEYTDI